MSALETWCTKEEVLRDLAEATGRRVGDLDEEYLVVGERPPPKHVVEDEDDEVHLLFGRLVNGRHVQGDSSPDLEGITEMLRMVNDYEREEEVYNNALVNPADAIITISKVTELNPDVKEFVPKYAMDSSASSSNLDDTDKLNNNRIKNTSTKTEDTGKINKLNDVNVTASNVNQEESEDVKELREKMKKQISDSLKSDSFEKKKQKNVAIATLLKLNAAKSSSNKIQNKICDTNQAFKLMTPDDFQSYICIPKDSILTREHPSPDTKNSLSLVSEDYSKCNDSSSSTSGKHKTRESNPVLSPEEKASIDKVNKWLEEPGKNKSLPVFSSPIGFKRKESKAPKSPVTNVQNNIKPYSNHIEQYKPTKHATDLSKQYRERTKAQNAKRNNWTDLDIILKEKDLQIKKRFEESQQSRD